MKAANRTPRTTVGDLLARKFKQSRHRGIAAFEILEASKNSSVF
jgi:hypothetical protein